MTEHLSIIRGDARPVSSETLLDRLCWLGNLTRVEALGLLKCGRVRVNGRRVSLASAVVSDADTVTYTEHGVEMVLRYAASERRLSSQPERVQP